MKKIIAMDIGSSTVKACVFGLAEEIMLLYSCTADIKIYSPKPGYFEHDPREVWEAVCESLHDVFTNSDFDKSEISLISICSQAQCVLLADKSGTAVTNIYNSQDGRAKDTFNRHFADGIIKVDGVNLFKVAGCVLSTGFTPGTAKDPVFKYKWAEENLPNEYKKAYKWLDIKDYIILKLTGEFATTKDNAHAYTVYNSRKNDGSWSKTAAKIFRIDMDKLPRVIESTDIAGYVTGEASERTGLAAGTPVIGGIIDSTGVQYGSGAAEVGDIMVYWGTSGWVGTVTDRLAINFIDRMGALITALDNRFHYYACLDSAGISYTWLKEHIIENDGVLKEGGAVEGAHIYEIMNKALADVAPGADGLMYAPWLTGLRAPVEASDIGAVFVNIKNSMDKRHFIRAVVEGICYQYRLLMELGAKQVGTRKNIRFVGGGAHSDEIAQILADITGCEVEVPPNPREAGAVGAAIIGFLALDDKVDLSELLRRQRAEKVFIPDDDMHKLYDRYYSVFKMLYKKNKKILSRLTSISEGR